MNIDRLKKVMSESLTEKVLKDIVGRSSSQVKPAFKGAFKKKAKANFGEDWSDEEEIDAAEDDQWHDAQSYYDWGRR